MGFPNYPPPPTEAPTCYRHPDRQTYVRCTRCNRYICGECMRDAAVGHQCVECVNEGAKTIRPVRTQFGGVQPASAVPWVSYTLMALNAIALVAIPAVAAMMGVRAWDITSDFVLWPVGVARGEYYRLITSAFLHDGPLHLVFNLWALFVVGPPLERWLGRLRFITLYLMSALGGSVVVYLLSEVNSSTVGASGAVFGLFGATFVVARRLNLDVRWVVGLIAINVVITFVVPAVSWQGHLGGLVTGLLVSAAFVYAPRVQRNLVQAGAVVGLLAVFVALIFWRTASLVSQYNLALGA